jgi:hypothetical protein
LDNAGLLSIVDGGGYGFGGGGGGGGLPPKSQRIKIKI